MPSSTTTAPWKTILLRSARSIVSPLRRLPVVAGRELPVQWGSSQPRRRRAMAYDGYQCLRIRVERGVAFATIDHPPINLLDVALIQELDRLGREVAADDAVRVLVLDSADPEFFV